MPHAHFKALAIIPLLLLSGLTLSQPPRPAPVPDAIKIQHPTPENVTQARKSLATYLASLDATTRQLFEKFPELLAVHEPTLSNSAVIPNLSASFLPKHQNNVAVANAGNIDVLFMGDSITDFWRNETGPYAGKPVLDKYFGTMKVANFGIAGDTTQGVLYRLQDGEGQGFSPKAIMLMIGTNNVRTNSAGEIAEGVGAVVLELQKDFPNAKILLLGIFPRSTHDDPLRAQLAQVNSIISKLDDKKRVHYLDIGKIFLDANGDIQKDIMSDGLHPTTKGYELWANAVIQPLKNLLN